VYGRAQANYGGPPARSLAGPAAVVSAKPLVDLALVPGSRRTPRNLRFGSGHRTIENRREQSSRSVGPMAERMEPRRKCAVYARCFSKTTHSLGVLLIRVLCIGLSTPDDGRECGREQGARRSLLTRSQKTGGLYCLDREGNCRSRAVTSKPARQFSAPWEEALRVRSKSLDARQAATNDRDAAPDERDREQATTKHASVCEERERALAARESEIEAKQRDLEELAARVAEREAALDARSRALEARVAELSHRDQLGSSVQGQIESLPTAQNESISTGGADQPPVHLDVVAINHDFLAAYMEGLLARSRRPESEGDLCWLPSSKLVKSGQPAVAPADARDPSNIPATESQSPPTLPGPLPEPFHRQDKDSVRAELDSLRHIANAAARSAIATHASKASREKMLFCTLFLTSSLVLAVVLLTSARWGSTDYSRMGWLALAASGALAVELIVHSVKFRRHAFDRLERARRDAANVQKADYHACR
jgi:hypothetical protein